MSIHTSTIASPRFGTTSGTHTVVRRLVWNVVPVLMVLASVQMALLGDDGLLKRHQVKQRLYATQSKVDSVKVHNEKLRGVFLAEPLLQHDQELCVLAINGGRLLVLAGRSVCMERLVRVGGGPERSRAFGHARDGDAERGPAQRTLHRGPRCRW